MKCSSGFRKKNCHWKKRVLAAEPQADVLPFRFQNERAVRHFHGVQEVHENSISSAFGCKLLVPDRSQSAVLPSVTSLSSRLGDQCEGQHHKPPSLPTPLPKSPHWSSTMHWCSVGPKITLVLCFRFRVWNNRNRTGWQKRAPDERRRRGMEQSALSQGGRSQFAVWVEGGLGSENREDRWFPGLEGWWGASFKTIPWKKMRREAPSLSGTAGKCWCFAEDTANSSGTEAGSW